jgi:fumarate reductase subunit C
MSGPPPPYTEFHPQWYRPRVSTWWFLKRRSYVAFILRELSCVFVAWSVVFLLLLIRAVGDGAAAYADFLDWADTPWVVGLNVLTLAFLVYHAVTWFELTPKAMVVKLRGRPVPGRVIAGSAYAGWVVVSVFVAWLLLRG